MALSIDPIRPYLPLVYGGVVLLVIGGLVYQRERIKDLKGQRADLKQTIATYASAQKTNLASIDTLQGAIAKWEKRCSVDAAVQDKAVADLAAAQAEAERRAAANTKEIEYVYVNSPAARAWRDTAVPRDIADRLP